MVNIVSKRKKSYKMIEMQTNDCRKDLKKYLKKGITMNCKRIVNCLGKSLEINYNI